MLQLSLGLIKNLCFDKTIREQAEQAGFIPKIVELLNVPNFRFVAIVLLYLLSLDEKIRITFAFTEYMDLLIKLIVNFPE